METSERRGFLTILVLFTLTGIAMITTTGLTRTMREQLAARAYVARQQALHLAEAGIDEALWEFQESGGTFTLGAPPIGEGWEEFDDPALAPPAFPCATPDACRAKTLLTGATVVVINRAGPTPAIMATAEAGVVSQRLYVTVARRQTGFELGLFGANYLQIGGTGGGTSMVDSYNSAVGRYDLLLNRGANARIGTNDRNYAGVTDGSVDLQIGSATYTNATVYGKAYISPLTDSISEFKNYGTLTGGGGLPEEQPLLDLPPIEVPAELDALCGASPIEYVRSSGTELITTDQCYRRITLSGSGEIVLAPGVRVYLKGDEAGSGSILNVTGQGKIVAQGQNEVFGGVGGFWVDSQYGFVNASDPINPRPKELVIRVEGSTAYGSGLEQQASFYGALYIRRGHLWVKGHYLGATGWSDANHYGAIISGDSLKPTAHTAGRFMNFHTDESLANEDITLSGTGSSKRFEILCWQELAPGEM